MTDIIGRREECGLLKEIALSNEAAFLAIYGRRRVGKTHLVRTTFSKADHYMEVMGSKDGNMRTQLMNFMDGFSETFATGLALQPPTSWREAFNLLTTKLNNINPKQQVIIFLDELPWLATPRSKLLQNLDYFWNRHWSKLNNLKLITCGSAASWMLDNLINAKGGLYNRITQSILLKPFTLKKTEEFLNYLKFKYTKKQVLDIYMITGGIPFYLKQLKRSKSVVQNINELCFKRDGLLYGEFDRLFESLFKKGEHHLDIIKTLAQHPGGMSTNTLSGLLKINFGGRLTKRLKELEAAGFIKRLFPLGKKKRESYYQVIDEYSMFYLNWIQYFFDRGESPGDDHHWQSQVNTPAYNSWSGFAFEKICFKHVQQIKNSMGLSHTAVNYSGWRYIPNKGESESGAQIDLLFDRSDDVITIFEIKYSQKPFVFDKSCAKNIANKIAVFEKHYSTTKQISVVLITPHQPKLSIWADELIQQTLTLDVLFK